MSSESHSITTCRKCPRLVEWRESVARNKTRRFASLPYWGRPVPAFGDPLGRLFIVGLAPAAHGANRTGRMFTGDRSGDWLFRALHRAAFASQPHAESRTDGMRLSNCYITALCRCAPPANKPTAAEFANCRPYLAAELDQALATWSAARSQAAILCLGRLAFSHTVSLLKAGGYLADHRRPAFQHGLKTDISDTLALFASYHPSQQNTFTGRLTEPMFDAVFQAIRNHL